jgi:LacI family transcriptional regulator
MDIHVTHSRSPGARANSRGGCRFGPSGADIPGVFCYNDPLAIGAMNTILEAGLRIPEDVAVIGCGNLHYDGSLRVPLSTVDQHSQKIGEHAGNILLRLIESKIRPGSTSIILDPALLVRASTQRALPV